MADSQFIVEWLDAKREPKCPPNPSFLKGIDLDVATRMGAPSDHPCCTVALPYPAKRIGAYTVTCRACNARVSCTTAGRPDDPRSIRFPCHVSMGVLDGNHRHAAAES